MGGVVNGPAPKRPEDRARRNKPNVAATLLPAEGYQGEIPPWPLARKTPQDAQLWAELWRTPQAAAWAPLGLGTRRVVARLVVMSRAAAGDPKVAAEVRQLETALGITPLAMLRLGWQVAADELEEKRDEGGNGRRVTIVAD